MEMNYTNVTVLGYGFTPNGATVAANNGTIPVGTSILWVMPVPSDSNGGGIQVTEFKPWCHGTIGANVMDISLVTLRTTNTVTGTVVPSVAVRAGGLKVIAPAVTAAVSVSLPSPASLVVVIVALPATPMRFLRR